ncbi:hypothetical protein GCM10022247_33470 [Allokutzneria multivorans]|uniref:HTH arsR-type domain-containing protein n=2 Tax=Allokutzneria multivorans TaxID=1142134 RepID=A0ABP7S9B0_9PSEU
MLVSWITESQPAKNRLTVGCPPGQTRGMETELEGLRVLAHPLRLRILSLLTGAAMSAAEAARELGESQANISYHMRRLHDAGLLEVAEEVEIRGGRAKRFRHNHDSGGKVRARGREDHVLLAATMGAELRRRAGSRALDAKGLTTDAEVWVDPEVWQRVREAVAELAGQLHDAARPPRTEGTVHVNATIALFQMEDE